MLNLADAAGGMEILPSYSPAFCICGVVFAAQRMKKAFM